MDNHRDGFHACRLCGLPLFSSSAELDSGTGWPSFFHPVDPANLTEHRDVSAGMVLTEIACARGGRHLGHVFNDGPQPNGLRFCLNSVSLAFHGEGKTLAERPSQVTTGVRPLLG